MVSFQLKISLRIAWVQQFQELHSEAAGFSADVLNAA
jgi:hypothetical protein